jgi:hypothetical protein
LVKKCTTLVKKRIIIMKMCRLMIAVFALSVFQAHAMMRWSQGLRLVNDPYVAQILQSGLKKCPANCPSRTCAKKEAQSVQNVPLQEQKDVGHVWKRLEALKTVKGVAQFKKSIAVPAPHKSDMSYYVDLLTYRKRAEKKTQLLKMLFFDYKALRWAAKRAQDSLYVEHALFGASKQWAQPYANMGQGYKVLAGFMEVAKAYTKPVSVRKKPVPVHEDVIDWDAYRPGC